MSVCLYINVSVYLSVPVSVCIINCVVSVCLCVCVCVCVSVLSAHMHLPYALVYLWMCMLSLYVQKARSTILYRG